MPEPADLTFVGVTAWVAGGTSVTPTYPSGLAEFDRVYAVIHTKPNTVTPSTPANWTQVFTLTGGGGAVGAGTGLTRITVFARTVPSGGLSGSQAFTVTGGSSNLGHMQAWRGIGTNITWDAETSTSYSRSTAGTAAGGTGGANISVGSKDALVVIVGTTDDTTSNLNITSLTATGATLDPLVKAPGADLHTNATATTNLGNDLAAAAAYAVATAGSGTSSAAPVVIASANASETGMGAFFRVSAQRDIPVIHSGDATLTVTAGRTTEGVIVVVHSGDVTRSFTATVVTAAVVTAPPVASPLSAEPGYAQPGAAQVGSVWTTAAMGGNPTHEGEAVLTVTATAAPAGVLAESGAASPIVAATVAVSGELWGPVRGLSATPISQSRIDLEWDPMFGATGYDIERDGIIIAEDVAGNMYTDDVGLSASIEYDYRVAAVRGPGSAH